MIEAFSKKSFKLFSFSFVLSIITYGFTLSNYSLSVDSETPIYPEFAMSLGRWGTNFVRYYVFEGHLPYFTLLFGLFLLSIAAVELSDLFKLKGIMKYIFCALFLTFPQLSYQLVFTMQADVIPLGFLTSAFAIKVFNKSFDKMFTPLAFGYFFISALLIMFTIAIYQGLILIPIIIYIISFFLTSFDDDFNFKNEIKRSLSFFLSMVVGIILYYISVKILCPPVEGGYLSSYMSGNTDNQFLNGLSIWLKNLVGGFYYGEKTFIISTFVLVVLIFQLAFHKRLFLLRFSILILLFLLPFSFSFLITNGYHPPRIYLTSGIVFAFVIVFFATRIKFIKITLFAVSVICLMNIYFITNLFYSNYRIFNHDKELAKKIDFLIQYKYPNFDSKSNYVYFFGYLPYEHHNIFRLDKSEIFGGSLFNWDNGDNYRIINFFKFNDINYYRMIDNKEVYNKIKDSISQMPVWPNRESIKKINEVIVVKLGNEKGAPLWVE